MGETQDLLELAASYSQDMISVHDLKGRFKYVSPVCLDLLGWTVEEMLGKSFYEFIHTDDMYRALARHAEHVSAELASTRVRLRWLCRDNTYRWMDTTTQGQIADGMTENLIMVNQPVADTESELTRMRSEIMLLEAKAEQDTMTLLWSKEASKAFLENLARITLGASAPLAVIIADIDCFKKVNDEFGHNAGDQVIKAVADIFTGLTRKSDLVGRFGGEEFLIALPNCEEDGVERLIISFQRALRKTPFSKIGYPITLSYGAFVLRNIESVDAVLEKADKALYRAKRQGRDRLVFYKPN